MKRRLPLIFVAVVAVVCLVAASVAAVASGVSGSAVAYTVNGTKVSQATVDHQLKELADKGAAKLTQQLFQADVATTEGSVGSKVTAAWLNLQIRRELFRQAAEKAGVELSDADRDAQRVVIDQQLASGNLKFKLADLPKVLRDALVDDFAYPVAFKLSSQDAFNTFVANLARTADVTIDPRYGRWSPRQGVCAPTGCATTSGG